ncbi:LLM class flavin-dependent oxidoreductase [Microbacterium sp. Root61]|uniref:LLM class flavin-dependent oxidoreductase n=1 Tax=Microbacterium sp. Root61 TaxID=1736570 RepID=UPI0009EC7B0C|nr:LLM class flavin-dependent oxidoreductase [Microbacterium sp. Root61]
MRICVNWLPRSLPETAEIARAAESAGLWGMGIGDSPRYAELYSSCHAALEATSALTVTTCVTNPVTRHWSVHASAARWLDDSAPGRFRLGMGRGDSAVHSFGVSPATLGGLQRTLQDLGEATEVPLLLAASGTKTAQLAGRYADGLIAGVGRAPTDLARLADSAHLVREAGRPPVELWATVRLAVATDDEDAAALRRTLVPRAISAAHFAFASTFESKSVPEQFKRVLSDRFGRYDYGSHGSSGATSNATMFADHPEIEDYLVDRFAIVGRIDQCQDDLAALAAHVDGVFLSLIFEDAVEQIHRLADVIRPLD